MADPTPVASKQGQPWRRWGLYAIVAVLLLFMALNLQEVKVNFILGSVRMPLVIALFIAAALGAVIGWAVPRLRRSSS